MLSPNTANILIERTFRFLPNFPKAAVSGVCLLLACACSTIPIAGVVPARLFKELAKQNKRESMWADQLHDQNIAEYKSWDANTKVKRAELKQGIYEKRAEAEKKIAPMDIKTKQAKSEIEVTKAEKKAQNTIIDAETKGKEQVIETGAEQSISRVKQKTTFDLKEQQIAHEREKISQAIPHHEKMTDRSGDLSKAAEKAIIAAQKNTLATQSAYKSVVSLTRSEEEVIAAHKTLHNALGEYDRLITQGHVDENTENTIQKALISVIQSEGKLEAKLTEKQIMKRSEVKNELTEKISEKNIQIDKMLGSYSKKTLEKLFDVIKEEIAADQKKISALGSSDEDKKSCETHLIKLQNLLDGVTGHISLKDAELGDSLEETSRHLP